MALPCSQNLLVGLRLRRASRCLHQCPNDAAARQFDLEGIVCVALGVAQQQVGRMRESGLIGGPDAESTQPILPNEYEAWAAAFELYRTAVVV